MIQTNAYTYINFIYENINPLNCLIAVTLGEDDAYNVEKNQEDEKEEMQDLLLYDEKDEGKDIS